MKTEKDLKFIAVCCLVTLIIYALTGCTANPTKEATTKPVHEPVTTLKIRNERSSCVDVKILWKDTEDNGYISLLPDTVTTISYPVHLGAVTGYTMRPCQ